MFTIKSTEQLLRERGLNKGGKVQKFIDSEVIRCMDPFTPFRSGTLKKSATLGTVIGSGLIKYTAPYARRNYYENAGRGTEGIQKGGRRGRKWFERMKLVYLSSILSGAAKIAGARRK
ncbi:MAG: minor capsid protein [Oscillospiraceae bacterium]